MKGHRREPENMQTVTVTREVAADPAAVEAVLADVGPFTEAGGFNDVTVDGDVVELENRVGLATMRLTLERVEGDAELLLEQRDGIFDEMRASYDVEPIEGGSRVTASTDFELGASVVGDVLDATVIRRQRTKELEGQLDYLQERVESE